MKKGEILLQWKAGPPLPEKLARSKVFRSGSEGGGITSPSRRDVPPSGTCIQVRGTRIVRVGGMFLPREIAAKSSDSDH